MAMLTSNPVVGDWDYDRRRPSPTAVAGRQMGVSIFRWVPGKHGIRRSAAVHTIRGSTDNPREAYRAAIKWIDTNRKKYGPVLPARTDV